ncbi:glucose dehydrogenase [FAD, quinone]-like [Agrilus planipennis]|uniref:Glucose dehydrogenase [FAD, quinone]-like n=1 Tax=Agrilus planipennis TaxID=224129 RepID=A0A7F5RF73_AGRPL|nr:glucose dehydrogenase [FAD, quinone]-like [Agrilus planipennis]
MTGKIPETSRYKPINGEEFDFIIVGAGSAGSAIANRLSEIAQWKILLLEAGYPPVEVHDMPILAPVFQFTPYNWKNLMEKQDYMSLGLEDQRMSWPRGKGIGGSSLINYMIHVRGNRLDYDKWAAMGNPGWSYDDLLPYFMKLEETRTRHQDSQYRGHEGYVKVEDVPIRTRSAETFIEALQQMGYSYVDYNGYQQIGVSYVQATLQDSRRCSAEKAYLRKAQERGNLKIIKKALVTKVIINPITLEAEGVEYERDGMYYTAKARKEVILSAGAFHSPQLLMLSGIGPRYHLSELDIPVLKDLPVGQKMYDHLSFPELVITLNESIVFKASSFGINEFKKYFSNQPSLISTLGGVEALAYLNLNLTNRNPTYPDVELIFMGGGLHSDFGLITRKTFRITDRMYNRIWKPIENENACQILPMLVHPKSYGYIKLKSKDPHVQPKLYGNYLTDAYNEDVRTFIASIRAIQEIIQTPAFQRYNAQLLDTPVPGCELFRFDSDPYWECALRHLAVTLHHQVATCKMGPKYDPEAIVDSSLRVYGIKRLRVADASVIPLPVTAHTNVPAYMIGEKASDLIKQDYMYRPYQNY